MTSAIIALNVITFIVFNLVGTGSDQASEFAILSFGHIPSVSNDLRSLPIDYQVVPDEFYALTALTSAFMHADIWHLGGNMLFIWVFGDNVEDAMGHVKYLIFYLICAFAAAWLHVQVFPDSDAPLIGASGAAAGIVAAYLMLHPKMKVWVLFLSRIPLRLPAIWLLGGWVAFQLFMFVADSDGQVSWAAHVGGIVAGIVLVGIMKRRDVPLFDREIIPPHAAELAAEGEEVAQGPWGRQGTRR